MQAVDTQVDCGSFTRFDDLIFDLFGHFSHHFFDTRRMDTSVLHELVERQTRYLTAYRIESGKGDRLGRIVHHDLHAGSGLERTDITSFASDDTSFDFVILNMEDGNGAFSRRLGSDTLDGLDDDFLGLFVSLKTRIVHDLVDIGHCSGLRLIFEGLYQLLFGFLSRHARQLLQLFLRLLMHFVHFLLLVFERLLALLYLLHFLIYFVECSLNISLSLVELLLTLVQTLLLLLYPFVLLPHRIIVLELQGDKFLFSLNNLVFLDHLCFLSCFLEQVSSRSARDEIVDTGSKKESCYSK